MNQVKELCVAPIGAGGTPCGQPKDADCHTNTTFRHVFIKAGNGRCERIKL